MSRETMLTLLLILAFFTLALSGDPLDKGLHIQPKQGDTLVGGLYSQLGGVRNNNNNAAAARPVNKGLFQELPRAVDDGAKLPDDDMLKRGLAAKAMRINPDKITVKTLGIKENHKGKQSSFAEGAQKIDADTILKAFHLGGAGRNEASGQGKKPEAVEHEAPKTNQDSVLAKRVPDKQIAPEKEIADKNFMLPGEPPLWIERDHKNPKEDKRVGKEPLSPVQAKAGRLSGINDPILKLLETNSELKTILERHLTNINHPGHNSKGQGQAEADEMAALLKVESGLKTLKNNPGGREGDQPAQIFSKVAVNILQRKEKGLTEPIDFLGKLNLTMVDERIDGVFEGSSDAVKEFSAPMKLLARVLHIMGPSLMAKLLRQVTDTMATDALLSATASYFPAYLHSVAGDHRLMSVLLKSMLLNGERYQTSWRALGVDLIHMINRLDAKEDGARLIAIVQLLTSSGMHGMSTEQCGGLWAKVVGLLETEEGRAELFRVVGRVLLALDAKVVGAWVHESSAVYDMDEGVAGDVLRLCASFIRPLTDEEMEKLIDVDSYLRQEGKKISTPIRHKLSRLRVKFFRMLAAPTRQRLMELLQSREECMEAVELLQEVKAAEIPENPVDVVIPGGVRRPVGAVEAAANRGAQTEG